MHDENCSFFLTKQKDKPEIGFTTGTCAAAASCAAARMAFTGKHVYYISILTPKGIPVLLEIQDITIKKNYAKCAVRKISGSDPDVTNGVLVYSEVFINEGNESFDIEIDGGIGVGRVTLPGLDQSVGNAAINHVPRKMISECVRKEIGFDKGARVIISIPEGVELAGKTFNPKLGIMGGISVLGTSGIVEPMSQQALIDTIKTEINMRKAMDYKVLAMAPGNYGKDFLLREYGFSLDIAVTTSNFIYDSIKMAVDKGFSKILFIGHIGKLVKVAGGVKNTHSKFGDRRMEILCNIIKELHDKACVKDLDDMIKRILSCVSTDDAIRLLSEYNIKDSVMKEMTDRIQLTMAEWAGKDALIEVIVFSNVYGVLGKTIGADEYIGILKEM